MVFDPERGEPLWGTFVIGWARKASDGLVGKARADAELGAEEILMYLGGELERGPEREPLDATTLLERCETLLKRKEIAYVDYEAVRTIERREQELASEGRAARVQIPQQR